ncbi:hypothetical protein NDU88_000047 [Pleurodeles waltl]|uniref:Uncharacterized protein n=1 Tax=Pleurodeles waltl TaxID=8319 RepID=A0AAV7Q2V6_PLEWA|nr:hypothetical protein NDU88_000047 [Pleurodeles waltl]
MSEDTRPIASFRCTDSASNKDGRQDNQKKRGRVRENARNGPRARKAAADKRLTGAPKSRASRHSRSRSTERIKEAARAENNNRNNNQK